MLRERGLVLPRMRCIDTAENVFTAQQRRQAAEQSSLMAVVMVNVDHASNVHQ